MEALRRQPQLAKAASGRSRCGTRCSQQRRFGRHGANLGLCRTATPQPAHAAGRTGLRSDDVSCNRPAFTLEDIRLLIEEQHGVRYHVNHVGELMRRMGLSRQTARPSHPKKDEAAAAAFKKGRRRAEENCGYTRAQG
jgi:hypothetical protein